MILPATSQIDHHHKVPNITVTVRTRYSMVYHSFYLGLPFLKFLTDHIPIFGSLRNRLIKRIYEIRIFAWLKSPYFWLYLRPGVENWKMWFQQGKNSNFKNFLTIPFSAKILIDQSRLFKNRKNCTYWYKEFFMWDKNLEIYISGMKITLAFSSLIDGDLRNRNIP